MYVCITMFIIASFTLSFTLILHLHQYMHQPCSWTVEPFICIFGMCFSVYDMTYIIFYQKYLHGCIVSGIL